MVDRPFTPLLEPPAEPGDLPLVFSVQGDKVHIDVAPSIDADAHVYLGRLGDVDCWAVDADGPVDRIRAPVRQRDLSAGV